MIKRLFCLVICIFLTNCELFTPDSMGEITVYVHNENNQPIENAEVRILERTPLPNAANTKIKYDPNTIQLIGLTNSDGVFSVQIIVGVYKVSGYYDGEFQSCWGGYERDLEKNDVLKCTLIFEEVEKEMNKNKKPNYE